EYYGKILQDKNDLKTNACSSNDSFPSYQKEILDKIDDEIKNKFYGCGSPIPLDLKGLTVLDLGCGTGRDVFLVSGLVGENGKVIGVDITNQQLNVAKSKIDIQMKRFRYKKLNVEFKEGYIENLKELGIPDNYIDVVISNCVINLSPDEEKVFKEIFRVLKPNGQLYFSDIFTGRRIPEHLKQDPVLLGECLGGALYIEDFRRILHKIGYPDYRVIRKSRVTLNSSEIEAKVGMIDFYSMTVSVFKLSSMEDICEDYGQTAMYLGTIPVSPHMFELDDHHKFIARKPMLVCGNTASMLQDTRFAKHFKVTGNRSIHYGPFDCKPSNNDENSSSQGGGCC
ncbi:hypothetical protein LCGC14_2290650, partial [marine sediment metagenome]